MTQIGFAWLASARMVPVVRRKLSITGLLLAWLCAHGAIWNVVQVVAWAKMLHDYSQVMPAAQAMQVTFSGEAPCDLCKLSESGRKATSDTPSPATLGSASEKIILIADCVPAPVLVAPDFSWPSVADDAGLTRTEAVPVRPPRV